jgi:hypothetical protein
MTATFAALETRLNTAVFSRLSNVTATLAGREVTGIFDNGYATALVGLSGMAGSQPVWLVATSTIPPIVIDWFLYFSEPFDPLDLLVTLNDVQYKVVAHEPDGTGMSRLVLELT